MSKQKEKNTLLNTVSKLQRNEILKYASNMGFGIDESLDDSQLKKAYADWVLANPEELMTRLPMGDLRTLQEIRDHRDPEPPNYFNNYLTPIMVKYGLVGTDVVSDTHVHYHVPDDLMKAVAPHLDKWLKEPNNVIRMEVETLTDGLANIFGYVDQATIKKYIGGLRDTDEDDLLQNGFNYIRQFSLLLDSMEWAENLEETPNEEVLFFSRYAQPKAAAVKQTIDEGSQGIVEPDFDLTSVARASTVIIPEIPNPYGEEFAKFLSQTFGMDEYDIRKLCFELWIYRQPILDSMSKKQLEFHYLSTVISSAKKDLSVSEVDEALRQMSHYMNTIPLWLLRGNAAWQFHKHIYMRETTVSSAIVDQLNQVRRDSRILTDFLNGEAPPTEEEMASILKTYPHLLSPGKREKKAVDRTPTVARVGRNDPCPCGSGLKYKKCHGRDVR